MKRGAVIKYMRTKKRIRQRELVTSSYSKSFISRIENDDSGICDEHYHYFID